MTTAFFALAAICHAQVSVMIGLSKNQFIAGEATPCQCTITNHTGSDLILASFGKTPWLDILVEKTNGQPASQFVRANPGAVKIRAGQSVKKAIDLNSLYGIREPGTYRVSAMVRTDATENGYSSNSAMFHTISLRPDWAHKFGIGGGKETREFRMMNFTDNQNTMIYAQLMDGRTGVAMQTLNLGKALLFRKPQAAIDKKQNMHVLFLATPEFFLHARIDNNGRLAGRDLYTKGAMGDPKLMTFADGSVQVSSGVKYDPVNAAKLKSKIRKLSDRPKYTFN